MGFRAARERSGKTINETAIAVNVSRQAVHGWETGMYEPSAATLRKLAAFYQCSVDELLRKEDEKSE